LVSPAASRTGANIYEWNPQTHRRIEHDEVETEIAEPLMEQLRQHRQQELGAIRDGSVSREAPSADLAVFVESLASAWRNDHPPRRQRRRNAASKHWWRTRIDPFADSWPLVDKWLVAEPHLAAKELLVRLREQLPDLYPTGAQLRTLQRRIKDWRAEWARQLVFATTASLETKAVLDHRGQN
jgi:hypothetical protein